MATAVDGPKMNEQVDLTTIPVSPNGDAPESNANGDIKTIFHDKDNFNVKHPLENKWTLWYTKPPSGKVRCLQTSRLALED